MKIQHKHKCASPAASFSFNSLFPLRRVCLHSNCSVVISSSSMDNSVWATTGAAAAAALAAAAAAGLGVTIAGFGSVMVATLLLLLLLPLPLGGAYCSPGAYMVPGTTTKTLMLFYNVMRWLWGLTTHKRYLVSKSLIEVKISFCCTRICPRLRHYFVNKASKQCK